MIDVVNNIGHELIELKKELLNESHSKIVRDSLESTVLRFKQNKTVDEVLEDALLEKDYPLEDFELLVEGYDHLIKSKGELLKEYQKVIEPLEKQLMDYLTDGDFTAEEYGIKIEPKIEYKRLTITRQFSMQRGMIARYFNIDSEKELDFIMGENKLAERFFYLRYKGLLKRFLEQSAKDDYDKELNRASYEEGVFAIVSKPFVNKTHDMYGIDFILNVPLRNSDFIINDENEIIEVDKMKINMLGDILEEVDEFVNVRMVI